MKKTKKHLSAALEEADARIDRLQEELRTTRQLNDELRDSLSASTNRIEELVDAITVKDRAGEKQDCRTARSFRSSSIERTAWKDLFATELAQRTEKDVLANELRRVLQNALNKLTGLQALVRTLNKNRVEDDKGVYVKAANLLELVHTTDMLDHFVKDPDVEQLLAKSEYASPWDDQY